MEVSRSRVTRSNDENQFLLWQPIMTVQIWFPCNVKVYFRIGALEQSFAGCIELSDGVIQNDLGTTIEGSNHGLF